MSTPVLGLDVSHHQGRWESSGLHPLGGGRYPDAQFVLAKATEGSTFIDPRYARYREQAAFHGVRWGAYHLLRETSPARDQADHFLERAQLRPGDVAACDLETRHAKAIVANKRSAAGARDVVLTWLDRVAIKAHCRPLLYVSLRGLKVLTRGWKEPLGDIARYPLWLCQYVALAGWRPKRLAKSPALPRTHTEWALWQYTSSGPGKAYGFDSSKVDLDLLNGIERWDTMAVRPRIRAVPG